MFDKRNASLSCSEVKSCQKSTKEQLIENRQKHWAAGLIGCFLVDYIDIVWGRSEGRTRTVFTYTKRFPRIISS